jgi:hypothetical protein
MLYQEEDVPGNEARVDSPARARGTHMWLTELAMRISKHFQFLRFFPKRRPSRPLPMPADAAPAHSMWVELATRIITQKLHYRSGEEETAAESVHGLFGTARKLMNANPSATAFNALSLELLNKCLRPYTARWHGWMASSHTEDEKPRFKTEVYRRKFRKELKELQGQLHYFEEAFRNLTTDSPPPAPSKPSPPPRGDKADLGRSLVAGIGKQIRFHQKGLSCAEINERERNFVLKRRSFLFNKVQKSKEVMDAIGLAFSGGGIRSATVCLGVVQVLAQKKLLSEVDYLSTVSGGGYLGTFLSSFFNEGFTSQTPDETLSDNLAGKRHAVAFGMAKKQRGIACAEGSTVVSLIFSAQASKQP